MAQLDDFETLLKEVVQAKRLSASKMTKLTDVAMKLMEEDTQLVSILYRTHKSLSSSAKISSLYVFDALARAAKHQVNKQNLTGNINSSKGNSATFLLRVEGILEGLFREVIAAKSPELKEKAKKVLDIWTKGNTFPSAILTRLGAILEGKESQEPPAKPPHATSDPRVAAQATNAPAAVPSPPSTTTTTPPSQSPLPNPQSALLALLAQAANAGTKQPGATPTPPPIAEPPPSQQLDVSQLSLLQQLAQTAKLGSTASNPIPVFNPVPPVASDIDHGQSGLSRDESNGSRMKDGQYDRYDSSDRRDYNSHHYDHVGNPRGGFRGGRGRGFRDRDSRSPLQRTTHRSRSRSPTSRYGARRDIKPYSPPRRPSMSTLSSHERNVAESQSTAGRETDEFGRERRSEEEGPAVQEPAVAQPEARTPVPTDPRRQPQPSTQSPPPSQTPVVQPPPQDVSSSSQPINTGFGLEHFDPTTFDFTSPMAWQTLGEMWQVSNGTMPSAEQLMQFVMSMGMAAMNPQVNGMGQDWNQSAGWNNGSAYQSEPQSRGRGTWAGRGGHSSRGRGGYNSYGGGQSEARVVAGEDSSALNDNNSGTGGRMQRVGDRWMFVRDSDATAVSS
ncbi:hypothetical protein PM082_010472 [Marasmius tenuissimus]|nr:hypothetical protein PM082_010472 [Marasmius tenuissimus]